MITAIDLLCRLILAVVYAFSGISKLQDLSGTRQAIKDFGVLNEHLISLSAVLLPVMEIAVTLLLLFPFTVFWGGLISALLLLLFIGLIINLIQKGKSINCHCFGQAHASPTGFHTIARNMGLLLLSFIPILQGENAVSFLQIVYFDKEQWMMTILMLFVIIQAVFLVFFMDKNELLKKRIETLEIEVFRGLPIGTNAPDFELPNAEGKLITIADLLGFKKPLLFLFFDPECGPCQTLIPKALQWHKEHQNRFRIVFIGRIGEKNVIFEGEQSVILLHPKDTQLAQNIYKTRGFPSAIVVSAKGLIDSFSGAGEEGVTKLAKKLIER